MNRHGDTRGRGEHWGDGHRHHYHHQGHNRQQYQECASLCLYLPYPFSLALVAPLSYFLARVGFSKAADLSGRVEPRAALTLGLGPPSISPNLRRERDTP